MIKQLEKNVLDFLSKCSNEVGKDANDTFNVSMWRECQDLNMGSPIEKILYCALNTVAKLNSITSFDSVLLFNDKEFFYGLDISPQLEINKYRVDFEVSFHKINRKAKRQECKSVIVECDSQAFHERTEKERRYEKKRDRFLISQGYVVFHYTGKEILDNPIKIAIEIISYVTGIEQDHLLEDSGIGD